ncbi:hypothetical protein D046_5617B, partial [Vibrio parahaemolyticus V-223/04]
SRRRGNDD